VYEFLRQHWAYVERVDAAVDAQWQDAPMHLKGVVVAKGAGSGDVLCQKAVDIFADAYGSEAGCVQRAKALPAGRRALHLRLMPSEAPLSVSCPLRPSPSSPSSRPFPLSPRSLSLSPLPSVALSTPPSPPTPPSRSHSTAALKWLPYGGLFISGGIAAKNPAWIQGRHFKQAYHDKGRMSPLLDEIPLYVVIVEDTGARGHWGAPARSTRRRPSSALCRLVHLTDFGWRTDPHSTPARRTLPARPRPRAPGERGAMYKAIMMLYDHDLPVTDMKAVPRAHQQPDTAARAAADSKLQVAGGPRRNRRQLPGLTV
jgi:hypothetical protein